MDVEELIDNYPRLFHMASAGSWPSIAAHEAVLVDLTMPQWLAMLNDRIYFWLHRRSRDLGLCSGGPGRHIVTAHPRYKSRRKQYRRKKGDANARTQLSSTGS